MKSNIALVCPSMLYTFLNELFTFKKRIRRSIVAIPIRTRSIKNKVLKYIYSRRDV